MAAKVWVQLLKDYHVVGRKGQIVEVERGFAEGYLIPNRIGKKTYASRQNRPSHHLDTPPQAPVVFNHAELYPKKRPLPYELLQKMQRLPPSQFAVFFSGEQKREKVRWEWVEPRKLNLYPPGERFLWIWYRRRKYLASLTYLKALKSRKIRNALIVDGSNVGWTYGYASIEPLFSIFSYIAQDSEQFFFPLVWVFDRSFRRKLTRADRSVFDEFTYGTDSRIVDYADKEIFGLTKEYETPFVFSDDRFGEYYTRNIVRIGFR